MIIETVIDYQGHSIVVNYILLCNDQNPLFTKRKFYKKNMENCLYFGSSAKIKVRKHADLLIVVATKIFFLIFGATGQLSIIFYYVITKNKVGKFETNWESCLFLSE